MSPDRPTWKGTLRIAALTIPVKVYPATDPDDALAFHLLHTVCSSRIQRKTVCPTCACDVAADDLVKGYETAPGQYVIVTAADVERIAPDSTRVIDVTHVVDAFTVERRLVDHTYLLVPDGPPDGPAAEAYALLRAAMVGTIGIGTLALYGREYRIALHPQADHFLLYTLRSATAARPVPGLEALRHAARRPRPGELRTLRQVIAAMSAPLDFTRAPVGDTYDARLRQLIAAKLAGREYVIPPPAPAPAIVKLGEALTASLRQARAEQAARRRPPRRPPRRPVGPGAGKRPTAKARRV